MTRYHALADNPQEAADWSTARLIRVNLRASAGRAYPRIIGLFREPSWVFFEILLPFLAVSAFVFVYRALEAPEEFIGFVVLGGAMTSFWLNVVWMMAAQFYWEKDQGNLELYFSAPMHLMSILAGMAIGGLVMTSSRALAVIGIGSILYGVTYDVEQPLLLAGVFLLTMIPLYGMGMLFASLFLLWGREAFHLAQLLQEPIYFLGGVTVPLRALGPVAGLVVATLPLAVGLDAMRQLIFPGVALQGVIVGAALWNVVFGVMAGLVQSILEDRERYRMIKYVVVTPASLFPSLLGRSLARVLVAFVAVALTLAVGILFLDVRLAPNLLLVPATILGVLSVI